MSRPGTGTLRGMRGSMDDLALCLAGAPQAVATPAAYPGYPQQFGHPAQQPQHFQPQQQQFIPQQHQYQLQQPSQEVETEIM